MTSLTTLTSEQKQAIRKRDTSIALAAGAGCGKTFVLTERFLSHLEPASEDAPKPADLHQLIAITFTEAAAREMRRRIREKCYERLQSAPAKDQHYWLQLMRAIEAARVSTIHSFCASLLRNHAIAVGLDPAFGVLEQGEADVLVSQVIDDVLRDRLAELDHDTMQLAAISTLSRLKTQLRELMRFRHDKEFDAWCEKSPADCIAAWQECFDREAFPAKTREIAESNCVDRLERALANNEPSSSNVRFADARGGLLEFLRRLSAGDVTQADLQQARDWAMIRGICSEKDWPSKSSFEEYKKLCDEFRKQLDKGINLNFDEVAAREAAGLGLLTLRLARDVAATYEREKSRQNKLDFDDLLAGAHWLLTRDEFAPIQKELSKDLRLLLIDEFQDTDQLQVELVKALCGDGLDAGKLFFVGDFKQSIYRFRGAQPKVFHNLRDEIREPGRLPLTLNFRSQPAILNFVNALFHSAFDDKYETLRPHRQQITAQPAIEFLWTLDADKNNRRIAGAARAAREKEARRIAQRLRQILESNEPIIADAEAPDGKRPVELRDIAILFRALSDVELYEAALRDYDLDYYLVGGHAFYSQQEIYDILNLLRAVASPADEIALAGVLRSPFFSLADETLFWLVESAGTLNEGLFVDRLPPELSALEQQKAAEAAATLSELRRLKDRVPISNLLETALARTAFDAALLGDFLGERKLANLNKLLEQARAADRGGTLDLAGFIAQLSEFVARDPKEALAATLSENADVVRLMTIHQAKGLEFPLVVLPDLDRTERDQGPTAVLDAKLGPLIVIPKDELPDGAASGMQLFNLREKAADSEERTRLLYVACTRAADFLILSSSIVGYEVDKLASEWLNLLAGRFDLQTGNLRTVLPLDYAVPQIRILDSDLATRSTPRGSSRRPDLVRLLDEARAQSDAGGAVAPIDLLPIAVDNAARRQFSVSRLSGQLVRDDVRRTVLVQQLMQSKPERVDSLVLGVLVHATLERIDFRNPRPIRPWCEQLAAELVLHHADRAAELAAGLVEQFAASPRWQELAAAQAVHREVEFLLAWPPEGDDHDGRHLQGYIDCLYQDPKGDWHLIDYKTNDIAAADVPKTAEQYEMQMAVYALAVEQALGKPPAELVLHFLRPGVEHTIAWNEATFRHGIALVNQAMQGSGFGTRTSDR